MQRELSKLTDRITEYRMSLIVQRWTREMERLMGSTMPLELKGLKGKAMSFRANIDAIAREYDAGNEVAAEHLADVKGLRKDVTDMRDDLSAAVNITKNSVAALNGGDQQEISSQEVELLPPATFHEPNPGT